MFFVVSKHGLIVLTGSVSHHVCDMCLGVGGIILTNAQRLFLEGCGVEAPRGEWWQGGGGRQWFTAAASQRGWWKWFLLQVILCYGVGAGGDSHRCVISRGLWVQPHHAVYNEEVLHRPQDCSEWVRPVNGETYPVGKANGCSPKKKECIVLSPWQQPVKKNGMHICIKKIPPKNQSTTTNCANEKKMVRLSAFNYKCIDK